MNIESHHSLPLRRLAAVVFGALALVAFVAFAYQNSLFSLLGESSAKPPLPSLLPKNPFVETLAGEQEGRITILILGISGSGYKSGELTDSIIVASLSPSDGRAHLIGLPRDFWVQAPDGTFTKINELYGLGGGTERPDAGATSIMKQKVEEITGLPIHYALVADLDATSAIVEVVGGLTIDGTFYEADEINRFVRDRSTAGGDFDRMQRQQKVIVGVLEALRASDAQTLVGLYGVLAQHISTSANVMEMFRFFELGKAIHADTVSFHVITPQTQALLKNQYRDVNGQNIYTLEPTAGLTDYSAIRAYISKILENT